MKAKRKRGTLVAAWAKLLAGLPGQITLTRLLCETGQTTKHKIDLLHGQLIWRLASALDDALEAARTCNDENSCALVEMEAATSDLTPGVATRTSLGGLSRRRPSPVRWRTLGIRKNL